MKRLSKIFNRIPKPLKNKYIIVLILFAIWIIFIDDYNILNQHKIQQKVNRLKTQKIFYKSEIKKDSLELHYLKHDIKAQEKFAREKFMMKKKDEEIFIIKNKK